MRADIPTRELGRTGMQVTQLGFGAMELRGAPRGRAIEPADAGRVLNAVLDSGINYIDTSIDYGRSEELIGTYIAHRRSEYFLASKCGCVVGAPPVTSGPSPHIFTRENIVEGVNQSLARMKTDYLDLVQFHISPSKQTLEETGALETVLELQREGKIRFIGMSGTLPNIEDHIAMGVFDVFQIPYSGIQREHEEVISQASRAGAGTVIRGGAAKGGRSSDRAGSPSWDLWQKAGLDELLDGMTPVQFILRFTFSHPDLDTNIVGTLNLEHLQSNVEVVKMGPLPDDVYEEAKRRLAEAGAVPAAV
jgi:aryl-alcohol dehydrogenase-like predicted oxidoreductase